MQVFHNTYTTTIFTPSELQFQPFVSCNILTNPRKETRKMTWRIPPFPLPPTPQLPPLEPLERPIFPPEKMEPPPLNPFQKLAAFALDMLEKSVIAKVEKTHKLNRAVDPVIQLEGNFAPVQESPIQADLEIVGSIPTGLDGVYVRNGGNALFCPRNGGGLHLFDGDGMIHALRVGPGDKASYTCRFTKTNRLVQEAMLGKPVFPKPIGELHGHSGLARLGLFAVRVVSGLINTAQGSGLANAGLVYFNGRLLAMSEDDLPYDVQITGDGDLETIGRFDFNGQVKDPLIAHPKVDPTTGDLYTLSYNVLKRPYLKFFKFNESGKKLREVSISLPQPTMIHDFAITESYVIIPDHQVVFKLSKMVWGGSPLIHDPNKISRFGIMPKNGEDHESSIQWIDVPGCFCFHVWNAWEEINEHGDKVIVVINSCMTPADSIFSGADDQLLSELSEIRLNLNTSKSSQRVIVSGMNLEAGQVNKRLLGHKTQYVYLAIADPWPKCSGIAKVDLSNGQVTRFLYGHQQFGGEPCFVPNKGQGEEDQGFLMSFMRDEKRQKSELVIVNASNMRQVASIKLPKRVPYGFHGTFVGSQELRAQSQC